MWCCGYSAASAEGELVPRPTPLAEPAGPVTVHLIGARGLRNADWMLGQGKSDSYCTCSINGVQKFQTQVVKDCLDPEWNHVVELPDRKPGEHLDFSVFDKDVSSSDFLGKVRLMADHFDREGFHGELQLEDSGTDGQSFLKLKIKVPGQDYPPGPGCEFRLQAVYGGDPGLELDLLDGRTAYVMAVQPGGTFARLNASASPLQRLEAGQYIVAVDEDLGEVAGAARLAERLRQGGDLALTVRRAMVFPVVVKKDAGDALHLELHSDDKCNSLLVAAKVSSGPVKKWNLAHQDQLVQAGDRIVAVDGVRGSAAALGNALEKATKKESVQLLISRPARDGWWWWK